MPAVTDPPPRWPFSPTAWRILLFGVTPALILVMYGSWRATAHFIQTDPKYCAQCHVKQEQYLFWAPDAHAKVACQACHKQTLEQAADMFRAYVLRNQTVPASGHVQPLHEADVPMSACTTCHFAQAGRLPSIAGTAGHELHLKQPDVTCKSCHGKTIHRNTNAIDACATCHEKETVRITGMAPLHCNACHSFRKQAPTLLPSQRDCIDCHASRKVAFRDYSKDRHMANFACSVCHRPHDATPQGLIGCASCHTHMERKGLHANPDHQSCGDCHKAHTWRVTNAECLKCHADAKPHSDPGAACQSCHTGK